MPLLEVGGYRPALRLADASAAERTRPTNQSSRLVLAAFQVRGISPLMRFHRQWNESHRLSNPGTVGEAFYHYLRLLPVGITSCYQEVLSS